MRRLLLDCARANPNVLANPAPAALLKTFGEHALEWELSAACKDPALRPQTVSELNLAIEKAVRKARIAIPHNIAHQWEPEPQPPLSVRQSDRS
jgi:small-conductance mechanosensitive channel